MSRIEIAQWITPRRIGYTIKLILLLLCMATSYSTLYAFLNDTGVHAPPISGTYAYNTFKPGAAGFPGLGGTYVDPVFGQTIRRLTDVGLTVNQDDIYNHHWCNANGTSCFLTKSGTLRIYNALTGATQYTNQPTGNGNLSQANIQWHPTNPDKYQYYNTNTVIERTLSTQSEVTLFTLPEGKVMDNLGGSLSWVDQAGEYYVFSWDGRARIWKRSTNTLYSGTALHWVSTGGWVAITPDGNYVVSAAGPTATPQKEHQSFSINHGAKTLSSTPVQFWGLCGDHGALVSASNGKSYFIAQNCHNNPGIYRIDIALNQAGRTPQQQEADNVVVLPTSWQTNDMHVTGSMIGALKDWVFIDTESFQSPVDVFNGGVGGWAAFQQEIIAVNVITLEKRRLAHHRSRNLSTSYYYQPRISSSWDGSVVIWASNMNASSPVGYVDVYGISKPLTGGVGAGGTAPPPSPQNLQVR